MLSDRKKQLYIELLVTMIIIHRAALFWWDYELIAELIVNNPKWLTWQFAVFKNLEYNFFETFYYLHKTPPIPSILLGIGVQLFGRPEGVAYFCIALQGLLTLFTACFMFVILLRYTGYYFLSFAWVCLLVFSSDLLTIEYISLGQLFYESLAMCLVLLVIMLFSKWLVAPSMRKSVWLGLCVGALLLTRSSYIYFAIVPFFAMVFLGISRDKFKQAIFFLIVVLSLQGIWSVKNYLAYGYLSFGTSSWTGLNLASGIRRANLEQDFVQNILDEPGHYPIWFTEMITKEGYVSWFPEEKYLPYIPEKIINQDQQIQAQLEGLDTSNSMAIFEISQVMKQAYLRFLINYPEKVWQKFVYAYSLFWRPIRSYSEAFLSFYATPSPRNYMNSEVPDLPEGWLKKYYDIYLGEEFRVLLIRRGKAPDLSSIPVQRPLVPLFPEAISFLNIWVIHFLTVPIIIFCLVSRKKNDQERTRILIFLFGILVYLAVVTSIVETGENMRFRVSIEPVIWVVSLVTLIILWEQLGALCKRRKPIMSLE